MNYSCYVGIDVSKSVFDAYFISSPKSSHKVFSNTEEGFVHLLEWLGINGVDVHNTLFCAENMGDHVLDLSVWLYSRELPVAMACPLDIKRSLGIQRGKTDRIDALKIARYAKRNHSELPLFTPKEEAVEQLRSWMVIRNQLVKQQTALSKILRGQKIQGKHYDKTSQVSFLTERLDRLKLEIKQVEKQMGELMAEHSSIQKNSRLLESIPGIGFINACMLICATHNFNKFNDHRKFACYSGIAPFEHSSGSSVRGKTKVSPIANKKIKVYLTSAAITAVRWDEQLKKYYLRKIGEGKHKASVLNAVKAKLVARCFAVIKRQQPFVRLDY